MSTTDTLLLNIHDQLGKIREQVGGINAKLEASAETHAEFRETHKEFRENFDMLDRRTDIIENQVVEINTVLTPKEGPTLLARIKNLEIFQGKLGAVIGGASVVVGTIFWFLWATVSWLWTHWSEIKSSLGRFFH